MEVATSPVWAEAPLTAKVIEMNAARTVNKLVWQRIDKC